MDEGTLIVCGIRSERVLEAVRVVVVQRSSRVLMRVVEYYQADKVSQKILRIVLSHVDYVNRVVWSRIP